MTIHVTWDNPAQTAVLIQFDQTWDWEDFHIAILNVVNMLGQVEHKVDVIFDLSTSHPVASDAVIHIRRWMQLWPANTGHVAIISRQLMVAAVVSIISRTHPNCRGNANVSPSLEEARRILAERRGE